jgi:hypothetical protein
MGDESGVLRMHAGNGEHIEMDERAQAWSREVGPLVWRLLRRPGGPLTPQEVTMSRRPEKHALFSRSRFFLCVIALLWGCSVPPSETEQSGTLPEPVLESRPLESTVADDDVERTECELEVDCCGNLNCAPAPCPIFCL